MERIIQKFFTHRNTSMMKKISILGLVLMLLTPNTVFADNTEDLMNIYGLTLGKPDKGALESEIDSIKQDIESMEIHSEKTEEYNIILENHIKQREEKINTILNDVSVYQRKNSALSDEIENSLLTADISTLVNIDSSYKTNNSYMNELLSSLNDYKIDYSYKIINTDFEYMEEKLLEAESAYIDALDIYELGDVKNIKWILPNDMYRTSPYGYRIDPINPSNVRFHSGSDYRAPEGTPIGALFNGEVISCGWSDSAGYFVTVQCGENVKYFVCHCSEIKVEVGQKVNQYDVIALSGNTGYRTTGPHLHMALYINGATYDVHELYNSEE